MKGGSLFLTGLDSLTKEPLLFPFTCPIQTIIHTSTLTYVSHFLPQINTRHPALVCYNFDKEWCWLFHLHSSSLHFFGSATTLVITPHLLPVEKMPFQATDDCPVRQRLERQGQLVCWKCHPLINNPDVQAVLKDKSNYHSWKIHTCYFTADYPIIDSHKYAKIWHLETNCFKLFF